MQFSNCYEVKERNIFTTEDEARAFIKELEGQRPSYSWRLLIESRPRYYEEATKKYVVLTYAPERVDEAPANDAENVEVEIEPGNNNACCVVLAFSLKREENGVFKAFYQFDTADYDWSEIDETPCFRYAYLFRLLDGEPAEDREKFVEFYKELDEEDRATLHACIDRANELQEGLNWYANAEYSIYDIECPDRYATSYQFEDLGEAVANEKDFFRGPNGDVVEDYFDFEGYGRHVFNTEVVKPVSYQYETYEGRLGLVQRTIIFWD